MEPLRVRRARRLATGRATSRSRRDGSARTCPPSCSCTAARGPATRGVSTRQAQWLANRGYLCVQVNFRGSTGYGKDFVNAGDREWGAAMHDDLLDAVDYVVERRLGRP